MKTTPPPTYEAVAQDLGWRPDRHKTIPSHDRFLRDRKQSQWLRQALAKAGFNGKHQERP